MSGNLRKTLRFQIGAIVSLVLAILLVAFISMHMVSLRYDREVLADKQEKLKVVSQGLSRGLAEMLQKGQGPQDIEHYFRNQTEAFVGPPPRLMVGLYLPEMHMRRVFGEQPGKNRPPFFKQRNELRDDEFFDIKINSINKAQTFIRDVPGGILLGRAEPVVTGSQVRGAVLVVEPVLSGLNMFRLITKIVFIVVIVSLIIGIVATIWILARLKREVKRITSGLAVMEKDAGYRLSPPASDELGEIAVGINKMADAVEQKSLLEEQLEKSSRLAALGRLVAGVAHEIRNPLGIMKATVQVMQDEFSKDGQIQEYLTVLNEQVERQNKIIRELLDYAKPVPPIFQPVDINEILKSILGFSKSYFQQHKVFIETDLAENPPYVNADVEKLKQAFLNLMFNAVEAMPDGGQLKVKTYFDDKTVFIEFADQGRGIPGSDIERLFDPFFTTKNTGTGLGLAMVHKIVEIHRGKIKIISKPQEGTTFSVLLPVNQAERGGSYGSDNSDH